MSEALAAVMDRVCIAIPTFRRPTRLAQLLAALAELDIPADADVDVVVFDNDTAPSARAVVEEVRSRFRGRLAYVHVPEPGLSSVRNAALAYARRFDLLAMIDDDEVPTRVWLRELLRVKRASHCDVVIGPVPQIVPDEAPRWLRAGSFYDLPTFPDGASIDLGYSGNCLLHVASLARFEVSFDAHLNAAGGEDMLFFRALLKRGARITYAAHAIATERLPADRLTARYLLQLSFRRGNTLAICDRRLEGTYRSTVRRAGKAAARVLVGIFTLIPLGIMRGRTGLMIALCHIAQGCGAATGLGGHVYHAYRRIDPVRA